MGIVKGLERGLEKFVARTFRGVARDGVKPVEISNRIRNIMDDESFALSEGRTIAPNIFTVRLGDEDYEYARGLGTQLAQELADNALSHANEQDYTLRDAVTVTFQHDPSLARGRFAVDFSLGDPKDRRTPAPAPTRAPTAPAAAPSEIPAGATERIAPDGAPPSAIIEVEGRRYAINAAQISIGRSSEADIQVDDTGVSRKHIGIVLRGRRVYARDLGSTNGTFVDGHKVDGEAELFDGSVITAGHTRVTFHLSPGLQGVN